MAEFGAIGETHRILQWSDLFRSLAFLSPMIIFLIMIGTIYPMLHSGMFEHYLLRENYKKFLKDNYLLAIKSSIIMPSAILLVFLISCIISKFNFHYDSIELAQTTLFTQWKFEHIIVYLLLLCLIQFFISLFYSNVSLYCCLKNQNKLTAFIMSYIIFIVVDILVYVVIYSLIINKIFGIKEMGEFFLIHGYWFFNAENVVPLLVALGVSVLLFAISFVILYKLYGSKEKVFLSYADKTV